MQPRQCRGEWPRVQRGPGEAIAAEDGEMREHEKQWRPRVRPIPYARLTLLPRSSILPNAVERCLLRADVLLPLEQLRRRAFLTVKLPQDLLIASRAVDKLFRKFFNQGNCRCWTVPLVGKVTL